MKKNIFQILKVYILKLTIFSVTGAVTHGPYSCFFEHGFCGFDIMLGNKDPNDEHGVGEMNGICCLLP